MTRELSVSGDRDIARPLILAAGMALAGLLIGGGFAKARSADRFVTVKGISEREVQADLAIWPLRVVAASDDLAVANAQLQSSLGKIRTFLSANQIDASQAQLQDFSVTDAQTNQYSGGSSIGGIRRASQGIFEILPRDQAEGITEASQIVKTVRVVSTIDYALSK
ncbi:MAG: SIMPL domain-containing protein [Gemmatimonadaceae bacterium]|nr:SIMPL domain-containing protein [Gemmatimonadaceae bacterium]